MRRGFIVRDRSLSSLPSTNLLPNNFMTQKSAMLQTHRCKFHQSTKLSTDKDDDIYKLKINLDNAMKMAVNEAITSSRAREASAKSAQSKLHIQKKYMQVNQVLEAEKKARMSDEKRIVELEYLLQKSNEQNKLSADKLEQLKSEVQLIKEQLKAALQLRMSTEEVEVLKNRIKVLELGIRNEKLNCEKVESQKALLELKIADLQKQLKNVKPFQQELQQRIALLERVNLQLQRKMEDFHKRQHEHKKEVQHYKTSLGKMTADRNRLKQNLEETTEKLDKTILIKNDLQIVVSEKSKQIEILKHNLALKTTQCANLEQKLKSTIDFYENVALENEDLKKKNKALVQYETEVRRTIASHLKVSEEVNLYIVERNSLITKLEGEKKTLKQQLEVLEMNFKKLDKLLEEGSQRSENQIKQSYYAVIRSNDKYLLEIKEMNQDFNCKILKFGEERDTFSRKIAAYEAVLPSTESPYEAIIADKTEQILMLESSNDQLLKVKQEKQDKIRELQKKNDETKKEIHTLRLKAAELFKAKKQVEEANKKNDRYQQMIEDQKCAIQDLNSQLEVLRKKNAQISETFFTFDLENKNLSFKVKQLEGIMKQLDIEYLNAKKAQNEKNAHVLTDSIEKMQSGIKSLAFYFSCCFCNEVLVNSVTLANCGHNFCLKCKEAYAESCYECDNGQLIEKIYSSKYLKDAASKYKFLLMVVKQAQTNLVKISISN